jgi:hypothetical protein
MPYRMRRVKRVPRFQCHSQCRKLKLDIENARNGETHIQTAHPKRKCNRPLKLAKPVNAAPREMLLLEIAPSNTLPNVVDINIPSIRKFKIHLLTGM